MVLSAQHTTEDNLALAKLAEALGAGKTEAGGVLEPFQRARAIAELEERVGREGTVRCLLEQPLKVRHAGLALGRARRRQEQVVAVLTVRVTVEVTGRGL